MSLQNRTVKHDGKPKSTLRPHHASATEAALASSSTSVDFKTATLVYLSLSSMAPAYPSTVSWSPTKVVDGDRCFAAASPKLWDSLPADLRQADINF